MSLEELYSPSQYAIPSQKAAVHEAIRQAENSKLRDDARFTEITSESMSAGEVYDYSLNAPNFLAMNTFVDLTAIKNAYQSIDDTFKARQATLYVLPTTVNSSLSLRTITVVLNNLLKDLRTNKSINHANAIADRIKHLVDLSHDESPEQSSLSILSLQSFIKFLSGINNNSLPSIVLSYTGNISAEWRESKNKRCIAEFLPSGEARYVVFAPQVKNANRTSRVSGKTGADELVTYFSVGNIDKLLSE